MSGGLKNWKEPRKFLIVDDHAAFRQTIRAFLPGTGVEVTECDGGLEALDRYAAQRPDWVLMDIQMPGLDGLTALDQLKVRFPEARVIIVTQFEDADFRATASKRGAVAYVLKENLEQLRGIIEGNEPQPE